MQPRFLFPILATAAAAMPSYPAVDADLAILETCMSGSRLLAGSFVRSQKSTPAILETRASKTWQASGGCKTNWGGGRCLDTCEAEATAKGYKCTAINSNIRKDECWLGWCACDCECKL
ncbi:hypothetical protein EDB81DRAFT_832727 [Dactylonectria macrodidyma]|uniref:Uncharacterized protein n=1 Tax=Dactylonectria macrodidyma TaxID=307937 RepID=A0A9P9CZR6_9HYPO|nr:hypothetical protein EDB81DRAFT_832727 [Dactylonectria macrodidyma]